MQQPVADPTLAYCVDILIDPAVTGDPVGFSLELEHTFIGDLSIRVNACGETLMLLTRPGGGSCNAGAPFGSSAGVNGFFTFSEGGGSNPDNGLAFGGGDYGLSDDPCDVNTVNSFAELADACGSGSYTLQFCIVDHASVDDGFAGSIAPIFPGVPPTICGCTDPLATNYNPNANYDDGSCILPCVPPAPPTATANPSVVCQGESVTLSAAQCPGGTIQWYTSPSGGSPVGSGPVYNTPALNGPTTYYVACDNGECASDRTAITAQVTPPATPALTPIGPFCQGAPSTLLSNVQDGILGTWSGPGVNNGFFTPSFAGPVALTFTPDPSECANPEILVVEVTPNPVPQISGPDIICTGNPEFLVAIGGNFASYLWNTSDVTQVIPIFEPGTYSVTVTAQPGNCIGEASYTVSESPGPMPDISGDQQICPGDTTMLAIDSSFDSYEWSNGSTDPTTLVAEPGTVSVTVTDAEGCEGAASVDITQTSLEEPLLTGPDSLCPGVPGTLTLENSGDYDQWNWSGMENTAQLSIPGPGTYSLTVSNQGCERTASFTVAENEASPPSVAGLQEFCTGDSVFLSINPAYDNYSWSTGGNDQEEIITSGGTIGVTVTDADGCVAATSVDVGENALPVPQLTGEEEICAGDSGEITLVNGSSYTDILWSNAQTDTTISVSAPGTYSVTVTDSNGCSASTSLEVEEVPLPGASIAGLNSFCTGTNTILTATPAGMSYEWSNGAVTPSAEVDTPGEVFVTVTNSAGCESVASMEVTEVTELSPEITGPGQFCAGDAVMLSAPPGFAGYLWSDNSEGNELEVTEGGTYGLTVTDETGCTGSASFQITENALPDASISGPSDFCAGDTISLAGPAGMESYQWNENTQGPALTIDAPGQYSLTVTDNNGCSNSSSVEIAENALPAPEIQGTTAFCPDSSVTLSLDQPYQNYQWSNGATGSALEVSTAGLIAVQVTNEAGCVGSDTLETQIFPAPEVEISGDLSFCAGDSLALSSGAQFPVYNWNTGEETESISISSPGNYSLTVTDVNGCPSVSSVAVAENALPEPEITGGDFFCAGDSVALQATSGFEAYLWSNGSSGSGLTVAEQGTAFVTVTDLNGCQGAASFFVDEIPLPAPQINGVPAFCPGEPTTLSASAIYSTYEWSTGDTTGTTMVSSPGSVTLTVANAQGCVGSTSVDAIEYSTQIPQIEGASNFCPGGSTILTAEAGFENYLWSNNTGTQEVEVSDPGMIEVIVTDANGCVTSNSIEVGLYTVLVPEIQGPDGFCADTTATISAGNGYISYEWSNGGDTESITIDTGGVYRVTVTDANGCTTQDNYQLQEFNLPSVAIGGSSSFCPGGFATLNAGGDYTAYEWSTGSDAPSIEVNQEGVYHLTVTDISGCTDSASLEVTQQEELTPVISGPLQFCPGTQTQLSAGTGYTLYEWQDGDQTAGITVTEPGTYAVYVEDASGCAGSASVEVSLYPEAEVDISAPEGFCVDESATLSAEGANLSSFEWEDGSFDPVRTVTEAGVYTVVATDNNGCVDTASYSISTYPLPEFGIEGTPYFCAGDTTVLQASETFAAYEWNADAGEAALEVSTPGLFVLEVTDSNGCRNQASLEVETIPLPTADAGIPDTLTCTVNSVTIGGNGTSTGPAFAYNWSGPGITAQTADLPNPVVGAAGVYELVVTDTVFGCVSEPDVTEVRLSNDIPVVSLMVSDTLDCATTSLIVDGSASSSWPELAYQWEDLNGTVLETGTTQLLTEEPGYFVLLLEDLQTGCRERDTVQVIQDIAVPVADAGPAQHLDCAVTTVPLSASGSAQGEVFEYTWLDDSGSMYASGDTVMVSAPGNYTLQVLNTRNSCQGEDEVIVTQDTAAPIADAGQPQQIDCLNPIADLNGTGSQTGPDITHQWAYGQESNVIGGDLTLSVDTAGTYFLIVTDEGNQCQSIASVEVTEIGTAPTAILTSENGPTCFGEGNGSILISNVEGGTSPYLYSFNGSVFGQQSSFTNLDGGVYQLAVQDAIGCQYEKQIVLEEGNDLDVQIIEKDINGQIQVGLGEEVKLSAQVNIPEEEINRYRWQASDSLSCYDCQTVYVTPSASGLYQVQVFDLNGCTAMDQVQVILNKERRVYLPNVFSPNGDGANDVFFVQSGPEVINIEAFEIYNRWGEPVYSIFSAPPNNPQYGWDGQYRGELMNGAVFTWYARVEYIDGVVELFRGDVVLMR